MSQTANPATIMDAIFLNGRHFHVINNLKQFNHSVFHNNYLNIQNLSFIYLYLLSEAESKLNN